ncbi:chloride channel protein [Geobacter hydrogenophilus]|uniref:CBS domain-containing protein n=1 Tax=Geobacter hydrogenophilus TaxID=40983 RepID=A0A9W6FXA6_9BACT|nr:chloride channel protein [Geobacter hydrogenophilus]MBT0895407.1 chloride channel protein [Geobacter hydrogenophilus]GLI36512.1 hypothetical protein GHYDROH2_00130 [Geobacter hydrogenophilus]
MPEALERKEYGTFMFAFLSFLTGIIAGLGALVFRVLIAFFHNLLFLGKLSLSFDANVHTPASPWGGWVILVPAIGAVGVVYLTKNFAPEAKGHGVPEVMDAIYYNKGNIRPVVAMVKSLASALCIGSGGSVGREGPIAQIGSAFGSTLGQLLRMPPWQIITLIAAGAGGGIAATFNTPVGGLLFATEILLHEVSVKTLVPVIIATSTATYLGQLFFGAHPAFVIPALETPYFRLDNPFVLLAYVGLGVILGGVTALYVRSVYAFERFFDRYIPRNDYLRHMAGMLLVGLISFILLKTSGHYHVEGVGYATIQDVLTGSMGTEAILLLLCLLKLVATALTLGSGGSGGIFSPSLFIGATLGGAYGIALHRMLPGLAISPPAFAVAGMAGLVGGATGAALTAIVMILEMTLDYNVVIPMTVTVAFCYSVRRHLCRQSIYTMKLVLRGHYMPESLHSNVYDLKRAKDIMETRRGIVPASTTLRDLACLVREAPGVPWFLVADSNELIGIFSRQAALEAILTQGDSVLAADAACRSYITINGNIPLYSILAHLRLAHAEMAVVTQGNPVTVESILGVIGKEEIAGIMAEAVEIFPG